MFIKHKKIYVMCYMFIIKKLPLFWRRNSTQTFHRNKFLIWLQKHMQCLIMTQKQAQVRMTFLDNFANLGFGLHVYCPWVTPRCTSMCCGLETVHWSESWCWSARWIFHKLGYAFCDWTDRGSTKTCVQMGGCVGFSKPTWLLFRVFFFLNREEESNLKV